MRAFRFVRPCPSNGRRELRPRKVAPCPSSCSGTISSKRWRKTLEMLDSNPNPFCDRLFRLVLGSETCLRRHTCDGSRQHGFDAKCQCARRMDKVQLRRCSRAAMPCSIATILKPLTLCSRTCKPAIRLQSKGWSLRLT